MVPKLQSKEAVQCVMPRALLSNPDILSHLISRAFRNRDIQASHRLRPAEAHEAAVDLCQLCSFPLADVERVSVSTEKCFEGFAYVSPQEFSALLRAALQSTALDCTHDRPAVSSQLSTAQCMHDRPASSSQLAVAQCTGSQAVGVLNKVERISKTLNSDIRKSDLKTGFEAVASKAKQKDCSEALRCIEPSLESSYVEASAGASRTTSAGSRASTITWASCSSEVASSSPSKALKQGNMERAASRHRACAIIRAYISLLRSWRRGAVAASEFLVEVVFDGLMKGGTAKKSLPPLKARVAVPVSHGELRHRVDPVANAMQLQGLDVTVRQVFNSGIYSEILEVVRGAETVGDLLEGVHPSEAQCICFSARQLCLCFVEGALGAASSILAAGGRLRIASIRPARVEVLYPPSGRKEAIRIARIKAQGLSEASRDGNQREFPLRRSTGHVSPFELRASLHQKSFTEVKPVDLEDSWQCSICLSNGLSCGAVVMLPCKHAFHRSCILPWLRGPGKLCPVGRCPVPGSCHLEMDFELTGSAWRMLPEGVIAKDLPTTVQSLIFEKRQLRPITWAQVRGRRKALARRFLSAPAAAFFLEVQPQVIELP